MIMVSKDRFSDDYVATLLASDAKTFIDKYSSSSLDALKPTTLSKTKPKPNTRFLKNIIKETDSHNAALRAKEVHDAKVRLRRLQGDKAESSESRKRWRDEDDHRQKRSRLDHGQEPSRKTHGSSPSESKGNDYLGSKRSRRREHGPEGDMNHEKYEGFRHRRHDHRSHRRCSRERSRDPDRRAARGRSSRRMDLSSSSDVDKGHRHNHKRPRRRAVSATSPSADSVLPGSVDKSCSITSASSQSHVAQTEKKKGCRQHILPGNGSDSDPLESIIGPLPPRVPKIQARGRGTFKSSSTIDSHFSSHYNPSEDVQPNSDSENSWDQALEALRDRQRWKQHGADRLRSAGFTEEEVGKWERGGEKRQEDVRWSGRGEKREWDRGKVMGETGVETKAEWALSKGSAHVTGIFGEHV